MYTNGVKIVDKSEKYLKSIDNTLSDILKELKRQGRPKETVLITTDGKDESGIVKGLDFGRDITSEYL